jgi:acetylglutamate kinase
MNQLTIIKVDDKVIEKKETLQAFLKDFALIAGHKVLIHGGNYVASQIGEKLGIETKTDNNALITEIKTVKIVAMAYAGLINKYIVAQLQALKLDAIGLSGADMNLILSAGSSVDARSSDCVGDIKEVNVSVFSELLEQNYVPVLAPLTHDGEGQLLSADADMIASEIAKALAYDFNVRLIYCFEGKGILLNENDEDNVIEEIDRELFEQYKEKGIIRVDMIPKIENALQAIAVGVKEIIITRAKDMNTGKGAFIQINKQ